MKSTTIVILTTSLFLQVLNQAKTEQQNCISRDYGNDGTVCVCNTTYCDTIPKVQPLEPSNYIKYTSNKFGLRFEKESGKFETIIKIEISNNTNNDTNNKITINSDETYQTINGWGGAFTDATGINIKVLPNEAQKLLLRSYFSEDGIEYNLCRVPIGGTDFSTRGYSLDDAETKDMDLAYFKLQTEDFEYKIPYILQALNLSADLHLIASAWTAPKWMKTNSQYAGFGFIIKSLFQTWANYHVKFLDEYAKEGVQFWGITTGNEPSLILDPFNKINSVGWIPTQMRNYVKNNLGPTLKKSNFSDIKILIIDDQRTMLPWYPTIVLDDADSSDYVSGIAVHWYWNFIAPAKILTITHNKFPDKFILSTEASNGYLPWEQDVILGSWTRGEYYSNDIIENINNWGTGWIDWNMALNVSGGPTYVDNNLDSPIIVNSTGKEFYKNPMFYHIGHFSKFVPRNSMRVQISTFDESVPVTAFKRPDNGTVVVILNKKNENVSISLVDESRGVIPLDLTERSITTILYW